MWAQSAALKAAIASRDARAYEQLDVLENGKSIYTLTPSGGSFDLDETRPIRRTLSGITMSDPDGALSPTDANELLDPRSGNELAYYNGYYLADGTTETNPCGVYRLSKPVVAIKPEGVTVTLSGQDRMRQLQRVRWDKPFPIQAGIPVSTALRQILEDRMPNTDLSGIQALDATTPSGLVFGTTSSSDPAQDAIGLCTNIGAELFFDGAGNPVARKLIDPDTAAFVASYIAGHGGVGLADAERDLDEDKVFSGVIVTSASTGSDETVLAEWWDDALVATFGKVPAFFNSPLVINQSQADAAAPRLGRRLKQRAETVQITLNHVNPGFEGSDALWVARDGVGGLGAKYLVQSFNGTVGALGQMKLISRSTAFTVPPPEGTFS